MAPAEGQVTEIEPGNAPQVAQGLVAISTAVLFGGLGIADGGIEPGGYSFAGVAAWFTVLLIVLLGGGLVRRLPRGAYIGAALLFGLALLAALSATWSGDAGSSLDVAVRSSLYVAILLGGAVAVAAGAGRALLAGLAIGGLAIVGVALAGRLIAGDLAPSDVADIQSIAGGRLTSPVGYWNGLGAVAAVTVVALVWLGSHARTLGWRALAVALAPAAVLALGMTSSRGAAVGLVGGLAILGLAAPSRGRVIGFTALIAIVTAPAFLAFRATDDLRLGLETGSADSAGLIVLGLIAVGMLVAGLVARARDGRLADWSPKVPGARALAVIGVVCAALLALAVATTSGDEVTDAALSPGEQAGEIARQSDSYRVAYWTSALDAWSSEPIRGVGAGGFQIWWLADPGEDQPVTHAHSLVFEPLAELGVVGLLITLGFVGLVAIVGVVRARSKGSGEGGVLVAGGLGVFVAVLLPSVVDWTWQVPVAMVGLLGGAAVVLGLDGVAGEGRGRRHLLLIGVVAIASLALSASTYLRVTEIENARGALAELDYPAAIDAAQQADRWSPWSPDGLEHEAAALAADKKLGPAASRMREAIDLAPKNWLVWLEAGRIAEARGERKEAKRRYDEAERLNEFLEIDRSGLKAKGRDSDRKRKRGRN